MINWKIRLKSKEFWVAIIPAVLLLVQQVCGLFGIAIDVSGIQDQLVAIVGTAFAILVILGVVVDPTTKGFGDSDQAMTYDKPKEREA